MLERIFSIVCASLGVDEEAAKKKNRKREYVEARQIYSHIAGVVIKPTPSLIEIGKIFGQDHSTVFNSKTKCQDLIDTDRVFAKKYNRIKSDVEMMLKTTVELSDKEKELNQELNNYLQLMPMNLESLFEAMNEWHTKGELPIPTEQIIPHRDVAMNRFRMLYSELLEFKDAIQNEELSTIEKKVEVLDAFTDVLYLLIGGYVEFGFSPEDLMNAFMEVHKSNLTKVSDGKIIRDEYGKILKPESYVAPNLNQFIR